MYWYLMYILENLSLMAYFVILSIVAVFMGWLFFLWFWWYLKLLWSRHGLPATPVFIICRLIIPKLQYLIISKGLTKGFLCSYFKFCIIAWSYTFLLYNFLNFFLNKGAKWGSLFCYKMGNNIIRYAALFKPVHLHDWGFRC